jgi:hypothetical protein
MWHAAPAGTGEVWGTPKTQALRVHGSASAGTSASSSIVTSPPVPSQTIRWQSPGTCVAVGVPYATKLMPQRSAEHVRDAQSVSAPGQPAGEVQGPPASGVPEELVDDGALVDAAPPPPSGGPFMSTEVKISQPAARSARVESEASGRTPVRYQTGRETA